MQTVILILSVILALTATGLLIYLRRFLRARGDDPVEKHTKRIKSVFFTVTAIAVVEIVLLVIALIMN